MRTMYLEFPEYHTSADNLSFISADCLGDSFRRYWEVVFLREHDGKYMNLNPKGEPQLGKWGLTSTIGGLQHDPVARFSLVWVLNFSDGKHSLLDIAIRSKIPFKYIKKAADALLEKKLLEKITP
jgi:aminopeptidase-like protein